MASTPWKKYVHKNTAVVSGDHQKWLKIENLEQKWKQQPTWNATASATPRHSHEKFATLQALKSDQIAALLHVYFLLVPSKMNTGKGQHFWPPNPRRFLVCSKLPCWFLGIFNPNQICWFSMALYQGMVPRNCKIHQLFTGGFVPSAALRQAPDVSVALPVQFCTQNCSASAAEKWLNTNTYFPRHRADLKQLHLIKGPPKWIDPILNQGFRVGYSGVSRITYNIYQYLTITEILQTTWR